MSLINEYRSTKEAIEELQNRLKNLAEDSNLQKELDFEKQLRKLMDDYGKSLRDINAILDPSSRTLKARVAGRPAFGSKRQRKLKQYKNPHTGDVIETRGGNHRILKEWKQKWGGDVVESWGTLLG
ncbi:H-NS histone [Ventosimonas gracilis]|uniref:H-NS histone n=1 Tax=Ventosimonas gracilis TaxID=1680762 RepID=A0A139SXH6_9GAMM|nr:histone-like nucleoid-structuring protein MvaT [Ventosimonas gracilis]KXU39101.1 H-NS histone [Ventosimonas gracilis]